MRSTDQTDEEIPAPSAQPPDAPSRGQTEVNPAPAPSAFRRRLGRLRHVPSRWLHPTRRKAAVRMLRESGPATGVLFICTGNIYRSPYAALLFERSLPEFARAAVRVRSAGFVGPDRPCLADAQEMAAGRGIDLSAHRSTLLTQALVDETQLIVVMDPRQERMIHERFVLRADHRTLILGDLDPEPIPTRGILDPWERRPGALRQSYSRIERCIAALVQAMKP